MVRNRKRFISSAVCPQCNQMDSLTLSREEGNDIVECVHCGFRQSQSELTAHEHLRRGEQVIAVFTQK
jgi:uncharacterized metal-binding protein (TIGR02443 family)